MVVWLREGKEGRWLDGSFLSLARTRAFSPRNCSLIDRARTSTVAPTRIKITLSVGRLPVRPTIPFSVHSRTPEDAYRNVFLLSKTKAVTHISTTNRPDFRY